VPPEYGGATALKRLALARNNLDGPIPHQFGKLVKVATTRRRRAAAPAQHVR